MQKKTVNNIIKRLLVAEFIYQFAVGLMLPTFAVFVFTDINGGTLTVIGLAYTFFWFARILTAVPFSRFMDRTKGEQDEYWFLLFGTFLMSTVVLLFIFAKEPWHIYAIEVALGISGSMVNPAWKVLFTDHLDKGEVGYEWSLDDVVIGLGVASSAYIGALIAEKYGFTTLFLIIAGLGYIRLVFIVPLYGAVRKWQTVKRTRTYETIPVTSKAKRDDITVKSV